MRTIGIVGGGQLGRMLTLAALPLGFKVVVVDPSPNSPAAQAGAEEITADLYDPKALRELAKRADYITVEIEHLDTKILDEIAALGKPVNPSPATIRLIQDKFAQKKFLKEGGIPVAPFMEVNSLEDAKAAFKRFKGKMLLKTRFGAYDGRGNRLVKSLPALKTAWKDFDGSPLYAEGFVPFTKELAIMVARTISGRIKTYPVVQTVHRRNICVETLSPAPIEDTHYRKATSLARKVARRLHGAGVFGAEMFLTEDGKVLINEIAPRVHNSGHYTTEACHTSQFEQHIRAISDLPLGQTHMRVPAAVMVNVLGERNGETIIRGLERALAMPYVSVHFYGKAPTKIDRKMGHITATADTIELAKKRARKARRLLEI